MEYSELTKVKIKLYYAANYLYSLGKSHPQVVKILSETYHDKAVIIEIADQAMVDLWRTVYNRAQELTAQGKLYHEILQELKGTIADEEITYFIINFWYRIQTLYIDNLIESESNTDEGLKYFIISIIGLIAVVYFKASVFAIAIWSFSAFATFLMFMYGLYQKRLSKKLEIILQKDYTELGKLI